MLKQIRIQNIILIDSAEIFFESGLNVLSGETGSGKSAIMDALSLVLGERADVNLIRRGCEKGAVEALIDIEKIPDATKILESAGIECDPKDDLIIRREISLSGKSRAYVNNQMAQLTLLRQLGDLLMDISGQHANQKLRTIDKHRDLIDLFGSLEVERAKFQGVWKKENEIRKQIEEIELGLSRRVRDLEVCRMELEEISEAKLKEGEDEELFSEYALLSHSEEISSKIIEACHILSDDKHAILSQFIKLKSLLDQLVKIDPSVEEMLKTVSSTQIEIQEFAYSIRTYANRIESNPARAEEVNQRLTFINRLKKKYGSSVKEIQEYCSHVQVKLNDLENLDNKLEELKSELSILKKEAQERATTLTKERTRAAKDFEKAITKQLRSLNMPKVEFQVQIVQQNRTQHGDDRIEFYIAPNVGEHFIPIKDCASGGELSRIMLALQTILAGKEKIPTLVFDEIDANIGGETASVIGEKLREIGTQHQVLCITHFPQVAKLADHHLQIAKKEVEGRTITCIKLLDKKSRELELSRMHGKTG